MLGDGGSTAGLFGVRPVLGLCSAFLGHLRHNVIFWGISERLLVACPRKSRCAFCRLVQSSAGTVAAMARPESQSAKHVSKTHEICIKSKEFCIKNERFFIKNEEVCVKNDGFCRRSSMRCWWIRPPPWCDCLLILDCFRLFGDGSATELGRF